MNMGITRFHWKELLASAIISILLLQTIYPPAEGGASLPEKVAPFRIHLPAVRKDFPAIQPVQAWTAGENGASRKAFLTGEVIQYHVNGENMTGQALSAELTWSQSGPCGDTTLFSGLLDLPAGPWTFYQTEIAPTCLGVYTFTLQIDYSNETYTLKHLFVVNDLSALVFNTGQAFDKCNIPTVGQMQTWWDHSPYTGVNLYVGGISRYCPNSDLDAVWVYRVGQQGWTFIPTWVGPQAPCSNFKHKMSSDPAIAYQQGRLEAEAAETATVKLGFLGERVIYYDLEAYTTSSGLAECRNTVNYFMKGWVERLHELGAQAGVYGSPCRSYASDWAEIDPPPDYVWLAYWHWPYQYNPDASVWDIPCISNELWPDQQRIKQYTGGHEENWGNVTFNIDSNVVDSPLTSLPQDPVSANNAAQDALSIGSNQTNLQGMQLLSLDTGWVLANQRLFWTRQGGHRWIEITPDFTAPTKILGVFFLDVHHGWLVFRSGASARLDLLSTMDGGRSWQAMPLTKQGIQADLIQSAQVQFINQHTGWIALRLKTSSNFSMGMLLKTEDGGVTWAELELPVGGKIHFSDVNQGSLSGGASGEAEYLTYDGGVTWIPQLPRQAQGDPLAMDLAAPGEPEYLPDLPDGVIKVDFVDSITGWAWVQQGDCRGAKPQPGESLATRSEPFQCSVRSILLKTTDGGGSWQEITPGPD